VLEQRACWSRGPPHHLQSFLIPVPSSAPCVAPTSSLSANCLPKRLSDSRAELSSHHTSFNLCPLQFQFASISALFNLPPLYLRFHLCLLRSPPQSLPASLFACFDLCPLRSPLRTRSCWQYWSFWRCKCFCPWFALRAVVSGDVVAFGEVGAFAANSLTSSPLSLYAQPSVFPLRYIIFLLQVFKV
jgi:hypothetical protein